MLMPKTTMKIHRTTTRSSLGNLAIIFSDSLPSFRLHYAAANNFPEVIKMLIVYGADVKARNLSNETPYVRLL